MLTYWEKRRKEKRENGEEKKGNWKREGVKLKMEEEKLQNEGRSFLFVCLFAFLGGFCFLFCFVLFCFFLLFTFQND